MNTNTNPETEALINAMPPKLRAEARAAQKALAIDAAHAVVSEIAKLGSTTDAADGVAMIERALASAPVPVARDEEDAPKAMRSSDDVLAEAARLGKAD